MSAGGQITHLDTCKVLQLDAHLAELGYIIYIIYLIHSIKL